MSSAVGGEGLPVGTVTFLMTDVEGSTRMWQTDPVAATAAIARHDAIIAEAIAEHGGGRPADQGEGDSALVAFARARDAVECAVWLQLAFGAEAWPEGAPIRVRVALHTGEAELIGGNYRGTALSRSARLRELAHGGQVLLSATTADVVRDSLPQDVTLLDLGEQPLRDFPRSVNVFQLAHPKLPFEFPPLRTRAPAIAIDAEWSMPLPAALASDETPDQLGGFVGRDDELGRLAARLGRVGSGRVEVVLVSGEEGIGKTQLCTQFARPAWDGGATVLYGRCDEVLGVPYQPWLDVLSHLTNHAPPAIVAGHGGAELARLVPAVRKVLPDLAAPTDSDPETERYLLFGAVTELLAAVAEHSPVLIVLDDLHWADKPSLVLLRHLITVPTSASVLIVATFRDTEVARGDPLAELLAALRREANVDRLTLRGLDDGDVVQLLETAAGHDLDDAGVSLARALRRETEGNPFYASEILRDLAETGAIVQDDRGRWAPAADFDVARLPASVREVVGQRVARLGDDAQRILSAAAVIGREFDLDLLAHLTDRGEDGLLDLLEEAIEVAVIEEVAGSAERFTFAHAVIQRTLYEDISAARRGRLHRRVAEALEEICQDDLAERVAELAHHWAAATAPVQSVKAVDYARLAGERAAAALAPDEAIRWFSQAVDLLGGETDAELLRCELQIDLGEAQLQAGSAQHRQTLIDAARLAADLDATDLLTRAVIANNRGWASTTGKVDEERVRLLRLALERVGGSDMVQRSRLLATLCAEVLFGDAFDDRLALAEEAVAVARRTGDERTLLEVLVRTHESIVAPRTLERRIEWTADACRLADVIDDPVLRLFAQIWRYLAAIEAGDREVSSRALTVVSTEAQRVGQPTYRWITSTLTSMDRAIAGDLVGAETAATEALQLGMDAGQPDAAGGFGMQLVTIRWMQGRLHETVSLIEQTLEELPGVAALRSGLAFGYCESSELDAARTLLDAELATGFERGIGSGWLASHAMWALVAYRTAHREAAQQLYDLLSPWRDQFISTHLTAYGPVAHPLALLARLLGRDAEADALFHSAHDLNGRMDAPFFSAFTDVAWADLLADRGDTARAAELARDAEELAVKNGYAGIEATVRSLIARLDGR